METIKELRKFYNLTQAEVASAISIPLRTFQYYETSVGKENEIKYKYIISEIKKLFGFSESQGIYEINQIKILSAPILKKYNVKYCYIFGSYSKGNAKKYSDIDMLVELQNADIKLLVLLDELKSTLHKEIDLLDVSQLKDNIPLMSEILKYGVKIYG